MKKLILTVLMMVLPSVGFSQGKITWNSIEGIEYQRVVPAQQTTAKKGQVEVVELFWYGCPHCYRLEPDLKKWLKNKPENVVFRRVPAQMNPGWIVHAKLYYVAEILGVADKLHDAIFHEIQENHNMLDKEDAMAAFFVKHGISRQQFLKVYRSIGLRTRLAHGRGMGQRYGAHSVPTLIVNGKYRTNVTNAGGTHALLFKVIDELIQKELQAQEK
jgi:thiol:disulfide interchange protein DsbA